MCVQFLITSNLKALVRGHGAVWDEDFDWKEHVFPRYIAPIMVRAEGIRRIKPMAFGLIPFFEKEEKPKKVFHNARAETVAEKPSFRKSFTHSRCIVPIESFFEFVPGAAGKKRIAKFSPADGSLLTAAGIWTVWAAPSGSKITCFSILTTEPPPQIEQAGHDRCPLFLREDAIDNWLEPEEHRADALLGIMHSGAADIDWRMD